MSYHFLSLVTFKANADAAVRAEAAAAARALLGAVPGVLELRVGAPTEVRNFDQPVDLVVDVSFGDTEAFEAFYAAAPTRTFSERHLRPWAEVIHVSYDDGATPAGDGGRVTRDPVVERNKANFRRFQQEVIVGGDMSLLPELQAPVMRVLRAGNDTMVRLRGGEVPAERHVTHEQFARSYEAAVGGARDHRRTIDEIDGAGDVVWARWTIEMRHHDDRFGVAPTNALIRRSEVARIRFDDQGLMVEGWFMLDSLDVYEQIGARVIFADAEGT
jgi:hypothetical protein